MDNGIIYCRLMISQFVQQFLLTEPMSLKVSPTLAEIFSRASRYLGKLSRIKFNTATEAIRMLIILSFESCSLRVTV